jgi:ATP-dependent protease HslVU (ClpYQ) peptidase subunit
MSCIVGLKQDSIVYIGGDSAAVCAQSLDVVSCNTEKVFWNRDLLFGVAGSLRRAQVLRYVLYPPKHPKGVDDLTYINKYLVNAIISECARSGSGNEEEIILGYGGRLYGISSDLSVFEVDTFTAVGAGASFAIGVMYATKRQQPKARVKLALSAAAEYNASVRPPFIIEQY